MVVAEKYRVPWSTFASWSEDDQARAVAATYVSNRLSAWHAEQAEKTGAKKTGGGQGAADLRDVLLENMRQRLAGRLQENETSYG